MILRFTARLIDSLVPGRPFLVVGESYGGYLARGVVRERPQKVQGMLLICPLVIADDDERDVPPCTVSTRVDSLLESLEAEQRQLLDLFLVNQSAEHCARCRDEMLAPFEEPALILTGRQDCLVGYRDAWKLLDNYPRSSFAVLDMAGHGLQIEQATLFNALADEWLDRVVRSSTAPR